MAIEKALYTAHATSTGGRTGTTESSDGKIKLNLSTPKELGGDSGPGTNPEQLFASGYSACFIGAMKAVAARQKIALPAEVSIKADVVDRPDGRQARRLRHCRGDGRVGTRHGQGFGASAGDRGA